jgi:hypothetical protein
MVTARLKKASITIHVVKAVAAAICVLYRARDETSLAASADPPLKPNQPNLCTPSEHISKQSTSLHRPVVE